MIPGTGFIYIGKAKIIIAGILLLFHIGLLFYRTFNKDPVVDAVAYLSFAIAMAVTASACAELINENGKGKMVVSLVNLPNIGGKDGGYPGTERVVKFNRQDVKNMQSYAVRYLLVS